MRGGALSWLLANFWRMALGLLGLGLGLSVALFGVRKTLLILGLGVLGFLIGKWMDEGRPGGGLLRDFNRQDD